MTATQPILARDRLLRHRLEAGLSQRALARAIGMTSMSIAALEDGRNHDELSLRHLVRISHALNVDPAALFAGERPPLEPATDDVLVEAALARAESYTRVDHLARGLGWSLERTTAALEQLRARLDATGQQIATRHGKVKLSSRAGVLTDAQEREIAQTQLHERGLTLSLAQVLRQAVDGRIDARWQRAADAGKLLSLGSLLKLGLLERVGDTYVAAGPVAFAVQLVEGGQVFGGRDASSGAACALPTGEGTP